MVAPRPTAARARMTKDREAFILRIVRWIRCCMVRIEAVSLDE